jgi:hypothetical protein
MVDEPPKTPPEALAVPDPLPVGTPSARFVAQHYSSWQGAHEAAWRAAIESVQPFRNAALLELATTGLVREYEKTPSQGKAAAHRNATLAMMTNPGHLEFAHPLSWAPFIVVGEGGRRQ